MNTWIVKTGLLFLLVVFIGAIPAPAADGETSKASGSVPPGFQLKAEPLPFPTPKPGQPAATLPLEVIEAKALTFEPKIGKYPPTLEDWDEHMAVYREWSEVVLAAQNLRKEKGDSERILCVLAALYREGHNMDVAESGSLALKLIPNALKKYPDSVPLNWQASFYFLQISPKYAPDGERALLKLRKLLHTDRNLEVERGLVFAYLNENRIPEAKAQIDRCLEIKPTDETLLKFKEGLQNGTLGVQSDEQ